MKIDAKTIETYKRLDVDDVRGYLKTSGWHHFEDIGISGSVWVSNSTPEEEILLSSRPDAPEYAQRMAELVRVLARVENRSVDKILESLFWARLDIVRIRLAGADQLPLAQGVAAVEGLPKLLQAAAQAELTTRGHYGSHVPKRVKNYMEGLMLGQTEVGSFVLRVASPVGVLKNRQEGLLGVVEELPFGRRVTARLAHSVAAAAKAAPLAYERAKPEEIVNAVTDGVSSNLLEALVAFGEASASSFVVEVDWASALEAPSLPRSIQFEREWVPVMQRAADALKDMSIGPQKVTLTGTVFRLQELQATTDEYPRLGKVSIWAAVKSKLRVVEIEMFDPQYKIAVKAHEDEMPIIVKGLLDKQKNKWVLLDAHDVTLCREHEQDEATDDDYYEEDEYDYEEDD